MEGVEGPRTGSGVWGQEGQFCAWRRSVLEVILFRRGDR